MDRLPPARAATRTLAQHRDAHDLRAAIIAALAAAPIDEPVSEPARTGP